MNRNTVFGQYNFSPSSGHAGGQKGHPWINREHCFFPPMSYYASIISHLLNQPEADCELDPSFLGSAQKTEMLFQSDGSSTPSREASFLCQLPASGLSNSSQFHNEHLQAKRARVENIIQGMSIMPHPSEPGAIEEGDQPQGEKMKKSYRENRRKQKVPQQQNPHETSLARSGKSSIQVEECLRLKKQLHLLQYQLEQLEDRFLQPSELSDSSQSQGCLEKTMHFLKETLEQRLDNRNQSAVNDHHEDLSWRSVPSVGRSKLSEEEAGLMNSHIPTPEEGTLTEILKHELVQEVTQAVDSVLRKVLSKSSGSQSQLSNSPSAIASIGREFIGAGESTPQKWLPKVSSNKGSMSLITNKAPGFPACSSHSKQERKPCQVPHVNYPLIMSSEAQGKGVLSQMLLCDQSSHWGSLPPRIPSPESTDIPWQPSKLKSSVVRPQRYVGSYKSADMESVIPFPSSDTEFAEMHAVMAGMPFPSTHVQETLTPGHLKKAKLMFFFSRYPTSSLLKAYFLDVQFTRCITSQLIKWFSNFREFYYIQMEKFARQAILEGVTDPNNLIVSRNSELFRILNIHYNKGNDFEVPDGFLNVANLTLQEFFNALQAGKDLDPSWKKPIYKIISKLDSEIPDAFKSSSCLQELIHC